MSLGVFSWTGCGSSAWESNRMIEKERERQGNKRRQHESERAARTNCAICVACVLSEVRLLTGENHHLRSESTITSEQMDEWVRAVKASLHCRERLRAQRFAPIFASVLRYKLSSVGNYNRGPHDGSDCTKSWGALGFPVYYVHTRATG